MQRFFTPFWDWVIRDASLPLQTRLFRLMTFVCGVISLFVVVPANALQNLPLEIDLAVGAFGLFSFYAYWRSLRGRQTLYLYFASLVLLLDLIWFWNAGTDGSIPYYFLPSVLYPMALFTGRRRWLLSTGLILNVCVLIIVETQFPTLVVPFQNPSDRVLDLIIGILSSSLAVVTVLWLILMSYDAEQRRLAKIAGELSDSEKNYRELVETAKSLIIRVDSQGRVTFFNRFSEEVFGYRREDILGRHVVGTIIPYISSSGEDQRVRVALMLRDPQRSFQRVSENMTREGQRLRINWTYQPIYAPDGSLREVLGVGTDVTERSLLLEQLQLAQTTLDAAGEQIVWIDRLSRITYANSSALHALRYGYEELKKLSLGEVMDLSPHADWEALWKTLVEQHSLTFESSQKGKDGVLSPVEVSMTHLTSGGREYVTAFIRDISRRKRAEEALRDSEERFRQVVETMEEVFWVADVASGRLLYVSPSFEKVWGVGHNQCMDPGAEWRSSIHPEDIELAGNMDWLSLKPEGRERVYRIIRLDGAVRWLRDRVFPVQSLDGAPLRVVGVAEDITEQKFLEQRLLHSQRLESIGTLASGVAHDLNNILAPMLMATSVLRKKLVDENDQELVSLLEAGARRGTGIVSQLLAFSRGVAGKRVVVQPGYVVREMSHIMHETFPRNITIQTRIPDDLWSIEADVTQLHQVLMNLCVNARDAMVPAGGSLALSAQNVALGEQDGDLPPGGAAGPYVLFSVKDSGHGIPPEIIGRIFDPFFTTKDVGKGTGLGLSLVHGIVKSHGGFTTVQSQPNAGATFKVFIPAKNVPVSEARPSVPPEPVQGEGERVLVVDDEPSILAASDRVLRLAGYEPVLAPDGKTALVLFKRDSARIRLVVTDIMMPGLDGATLVPLLREICPTVRVVGMSGIDQDFRAAQLAELGFREILRKPYETELFLETVQRHLRAER